MFPAPEPENAPGISRSAIQFAFGVPLTTLVQVIVAVIQLYKTDSILQQAFHPSGLLQTTLQRLRRNGVIGNSVRHETCITPLPDLMQKN